MTKSNRLRHSVAAVSAFSVLVGAAHFAFGFSSGTKNKTPTTPAPMTKRDPDAKTEQWLSTINREGMMGFELETEERQSWLKERAGQFVEFAKKPARQRDELTVENCDSAKNPFCTWMTDASAVGQLLGQRQKNNLRHGSRGNRKVVDQALAAADLEKISTFSDRQINASIRHYQSFEPLEKVTKSVLEAKKCEQPSLPFLIGTKAEEFLPDEGYREKAIRLYELAISCGDSESRARAEYRYSLLQIWANHCDLALPHLSNLSDARPGNEFRARALFWTYKCGLQVGSSETKSAGEKAKAVLLTDFPFSLHSLILQKDEPERLRSLLSVPDTIVRFRSQSKTELNGPILAAEALIASGEIGWARRVLASINAQADAAEPEFQIYLAWLYHKVGDPISKFRTLTVAFRDHPVTISRTSLALYYPRNNEVSPEVIRAAGVNELVVMSLIRQESAFNERARSPAGALGLMQVMPRTARQVERTRHRPNLYDPNNNVRIGSKYFSSLLKRYDGDTELALAAYNAGPDRVEQWVKRYNVSHRMLFVDLIPFRETRDYVASIARNYFWYSVLYPEPVAPTPEVAEGTQSADGVPSGGLSRGIGNVFKSFGT